MSEGLESVSRIDIQENWLHLYSRLLDLMIVHLHYPQESHEWSASEKDEFREFRHVIGDVLKDCAKVLGNYFSIYKN